MQDMHVYELKVISLTLNVLFMQWRLSECIMQRCNNALMMPAHVAEATTVHEMDCDIIKIPPSHHNQHQAEWNWFGAYGRYLILVGVNPLQMSLQTKLFWARYWKQNQLITEEPHGPEGDIGSSVKAG